MNKEKMKLIADSIESYLKDKVSEGIYDKKYNRIREEIVEKYCELILGEKLPYTILRNEDDVIIYKDRSVRIPDVRRLSNSLGNISRHLGKKDMITTQSEDIWKRIKVIENQYIDNLYRHCRDMSQLHIYKLQSIFFELKILINQP